MGGGFLRVVVLGGGCGSGWFDGSTMVVLTSRFHPLSS